MDADRPPPSYRESVPVTGGSDAPPSYAELFPMQELKSQVSQAREEGMTANMPLNICAIFCKSIACGICYLILALLPVSMIVMGSIYLHDCNVQPKIPIFLIVFGCVALTQTFFHLIKMCLCRPKRSSDDDSSRGADQKSKGGNCLESFITIFLFVWIIVGSYYTFSGYNEWRNDGNSMSCSNGSSDAELHCCDAPVMYFAFSVLIFMYGMTAFCCFCFCCCVCCVSVLATIANSN